MKEIKIVRKEILFPVLMFTFLMAIYGPLEIYLSNKGYFFFPGTDMLLMMFICFVVSALICVMGLIICRMIGRTFYDIIYGMFIGGTIGLYVQGNWDFTDYGAWNGDDIEWSLFSRQMVIFAILWIVMFAVCSFFSIKKHVAFVKIANYACSFILLILIYTLSVLLIKNNGLAKEKEYVATTNEELQLSKNCNMLVIVADTFDGSAFYELVEKNPKYTEMFDGFTFYRDTMGAYTSTDMSIPLIVTGKDYQNDITYGDYLNNAYLESKLFKWLTDNGWEKDIYTDMLIPQDNERIGIANAQKLLRVSSDSEILMGYIYKMVLFRYLPQPLKRYFTFYPDNLKSELCAFDTDLYSVYGEDNIAFRETVDELTASKDGGVFQMIHIDGCHPPFFYNSKLELCETETSYEEECEAVINLIDRLFKKMKEENIYDNTVIFIMGDHGYLNNRQNPLLLVKANEEKHDMQISDKPVWFYDLQDAYISLLEKRADSTNVFDSVAVTGRTRSVRSVPWNTHLNFDTYGGLMKEYATTKPAYLSEELGFDGNVFAPPTDDGGLK